MHKRLLNTILTIVLGVVIIMIAGGSPAWADDDEEAEGGFSLAPPPFRYGHIYTKERENLSQVSYNRINVDTLHADLINITPIDWYWMTEKSAYVINPSTLVACTISGGGEGVAYAWLPQATFGYEFYDNVKIGSPQRRKKIKKEPEQGFAGSIFGGPGLELSHVDLKGKGDRSDFKLNISAYALTWNAGAIGEFYVKRVSIVPYLFATGAAFGVTQDNRVGQETVEPQIFTYAGGFDIRIWRSDTRTMGDFWSLGALIQSMIGSTKGSDEDGTSFFLNLAMNGLFL